MLTCYIMWYYLIPGELVVDKCPCPGEEAMYRCTVSGGDLEWQWTPVGSRERDYIVLSLLPPQSRLTTLEIGVTEVIFNVTEFSTSTISVMATISNPELLNGTVMSCGGQSFTINVPGRSKLISLFNATTKVHLYLLVLLQVLCLLL